jgi:hypothetical protein
MPQVEENTYSLLYDPSRASPRALTPAGAQSTAGATSNAQGHCFLYGFSHSQAFLSADRSRSPGCKRL